MIVTLSYKTCPRCHGTGQAISGSHTTSKGAIADYKDCWDCINVGYMVAYSMKHERKYPVNRLTP